MKVINYWKISLEGLIISEITMKYLFPNLEISFCINEVGLNVVVR